MSQKKHKKIRKVDVEVNSIFTPEVTEAKDKGMWKLIKKIIAREWPFLLLMSLIAVGIYWNAMWGGFVSDDYASITQNQSVGDFGTMFSNGNSMAIGTFLIYKLFGFTSSVPFHVFSLIHFILFCVIAYIFLEVVFNKKWVTRVTMLLFVLNPIHVEAVSWISGRIYLILGIYVMVGLLGFVFFIRENNPKYLWVTLISFILGFLTDKPRPFALLLLIVVYLLAYGVKRVKINWGRVIAGSVALVAVALAVAWPYIMTRINVVNSGYNSSDSIFYNPFFQYPTGISKYLQLLWFPADLTLYHTMYVFPVWLNWVILMTYLFAVVYFFFKNKPYFFALAFIVAAVLPSIMPVKVSWLVAERYIFLGSLGWSLFVALVIIDLNQYVKIVAPVLTGAFASYFGVRLFLRNVDWQTNHNLWVNTCYVSPNSHNAWNNIGDDYDKLQDYNDAVKGFTQSTIIKTNYADAYHNRANIFFKMGRLDLARASYEEALYYSPELYQTYLSLTQIDMMENKGDLAFTHAQKAASLQPNNPQAQYVLAVVDAQFGKVDEAKQILMSILKTSPGYQPAAQALQQISAATSGIGTTQAKK